MDKDDFDVNDFHIKPSDAMDCSKQRKMIRGNWSNSDAESLMRIVSFVVPAHPD